MSNKQLNEGQILTSEIICLYEDILNIGLNIRIQVTGNSMKPFIKDGDILYIKKVNLQDLSIGDLIFFKDLYGQLIIHRIVKKFKDSSGKVKLQTKGDSLISYDDVIDSYSVMGKVYMVERRLNNFENAYMNLESFIWKSINYLIVFWGRFRAILNFIRKV